jgi:hypothetical protein
MSPGNRFRIFYREIPVALKALYNHAVHKRVGMTAKELMTIKLTTNPLQAGSPAASDLLD